MKLGITEFIDCAHFLPGHPKCGQIHGHTYRVEVVIEGQNTGGMILDPVYEGKSMAGLIDLVSTGDIARDSTVLYAHLGGQPALNAYSALFRS